MQQSSSAPFEPVAPITDIYYVAPYPVNNLVPEERTLSMLIQPKNRLDGSILVGIPLYLDLERPFKPGRFDDKAVCLYIKDTTGKVLMVDGYGCVRKGNKEFFIHPGAFVSIYESFETMFVKTNKEVAREPGNDNAPASAARIVDLHYINFRRSRYSGKDAGPFSLAKIMSPESRLNLNKLPDRMLSLLPTLLQGEFVPDKYESRENRLLVKLSNGVTYLVDGSGRVRTGGREYLLSFRSFLATRLWCYEAFTKSR